MKKLSLLVSAMAISAASYAYTWNLDKAHARLGFSITHMMVNDVDGMFKDFEATIQSAKPDFSDAVLTMTAKIASINTDNSQRDEHLRSADFFDAAQHPDMAFKSKSLKKAGTGRYRLTGDVTMHGITKPVTIDLSYRGPATHPMLKKQVAGFKISGIIKRSDFNIGGTGFSSMLSDEVAITANGEFIQN
jgi:polyisoprenoid-binding protein YceI